MSPMWFDPNGTGKLGMPGMRHGFVLSRLAYGFFANINLQGFDGGNTYPGVVGTDFFAASASDLAYVKARATGPARLPFLWERMQPTLNGPLDPTYLASVKGVADAALAQGTQVFLDCHNYMRRPVFSQTATAPYTIAGYHGVDNPDGAVTRAHLVDLWTKLATYFKGHGGVYGHDIMNEPTSDNAFGVSSSSSDLATIMQACVNAIAAVDTSKFIVVEGNSYSSCKGWLGNTSYPLNDPTNQVIYSAHCYPDYDHSGTHFTYAQNASPPSGDALTATTLVDMSTAFVNWCATNKVRGHIGETNVGIDDVRWQTVLDNGLTYWRANSIGVSMWLYNANFGPNPYNMYPYGGAGTQAPQWKVLQKATGVGVSALTLFGPQNGTAGQASLPIQVSCLGYLAASTTVTLDDGGAGGTFSSSSVTLSGGLGAPSTPTVTYSQPGAKAAVITASAPGLTSGSFRYTTDPANPISSYAIATPKFSDWSQSNGSLTTNSTYGTDALGGNTAARLADNGASAQHVFNGPAISVLPGQPFEDQRLLYGAGDQYARVYAQGNSGAQFGIDVDLHAGKILSGVQVNGGTLLAASIAAATGGFFAVRIKGTLGANDATAQQWIAMESAPGVTTYAGNGSDLYMDSDAAYPTTVYVGPIHTIAGSPVPLGIGSIALASGTAGTVGAVYTATPPSFVNGSTGIAYQWYRDGTAISGATAASYTAVSADGSHKLSCGFIATNASGSSSSVMTGTVSIGTTFTVNPGNLVPNQSFGMGAGWTNPIGAGQSCVITPNYSAAGFAPDGVSYPTRVQWTGDYNTELLCAVAAHAAGYQSIFARTNSVTGDAAVYLNLRNSTSDNNFNIDNSTSSGGGSPPTYGLPTAKWNDLQAPINANDGFSLFCRGTADFLIWGARVATDNLPYGQ